MRTFSLICFGILACSCSYGNETEHSADIITLCFLDEAGKPVEGVECLINGDDYDRKLNLTSDKHGVAKLEFSKLNTVGRKFQIYVYRYGYVGLRCYFGAPYGIVPVPDAYTFHLEKERLLGGTVVDESGKPVEGANVGFFSDELHPDTSKIERPWYRANDTVFETDAYGQWVFGRYSSKQFIPFSFRVTKLGYAPTYLKIDQENHLAQEAFKRKLKLTLKKGITVEGRLVCESVPSFQGAAIELRGPLTRRRDVPVAEDGTFVFDDIPPGEYTILVQSPDHAPLYRTENFSRKNDKCTLKMQTGREVRFRVVTPEGKPIAKAECRIAFWNSGEDKDSSVTLNNMTRFVEPTNDEGRTIWKHAPDTPATCAFYHKYYHYSARENVLPREEEYEVTLQPAAVLSGIVVDAETGKSISKFRALWEFAYPGIDVNLLESEEVLWHSMRHRDCNDGEFEIIPYFTEVSANRIKIFAEGYEPAVSRAVRPSEGSVTLSFELKKQSTDQPQD